MSTLQLKFSSICIALQLHTLALKAICQCIWLHMAILILHIFHILFRLTYIVPHANITCCLVSMVNKMVTTISIQTVQCLVVWTASSNESYIAVFLNLSGMTYFLSGVANSVNPPLLLPQMYFKLQIYSWEILPHRIQI